MPNFIGLYKLVGLVGLLMPGGGGGVTRNIVGTHACPKNVEKGSLFWG